MTDGGQGITNDFLLRVRIVPPGRSRDDAPAGRSRSRPRLSGLVEALHGGSEGREPGREGLRDVRRASADRGDVRHSRRSRRRDAGCQGRPHQTDQLRRCPVCPCSSTTTGRAWPSSRISDGQQATVLTAASAIQAFDIPVSRACGRAARRHRDARGRRLFADQAHPQALPARRRRFRRPPSPLSRATRIVYTRSRQASICTWLSRSIRAISSRQSHCSGVSGSRRVATRSAFKSHRKELEGSRVFWRSLCFSDS